MPTLSPGDWMTLFGIAATALSAAVAVREQTKGLKEGQAEMLRQIGAVHKRLDDYGTRIGRAEINHAVLLERVENIRDTHRMRRAQLSAEQAGETPLFVVEDEGDRG
jgi:hypothetical protein